MIDSLALQALLNGAIPVNSLIRSRSLNFTASDLPFLLNDVLFVPEGATAVLIRITGKLSNTGTSNSTINLNDGGNFSYDFNFAGGVSQCLILGNEDFFKTLIFDNLVFDLTIFSINVLYF